MIYTLTRGDIPLLSKWIKKSRFEERDFLSRCIQTKKNNAKTLDFIMFVGGANTELKLVKNFGLIEE